MSSNLTVEQIDEQIAKAMAFQSMTVDGDTTMNQSLKTLMDARRELLAEEDRNSGRRKTVLSFDMSKQNF